MEFGDKIIYTHIVERPPFKTISKEGIFIGYKKYGKKRNQTNRQRIVYVVFNGNKTVSRVPIFSIKKYVGGEE